MLRQQIKKTLKHTIIYGLGGSLSPIIGLLILPIFTNYLSSRDYGILALLMIGSNLLLGIIDFGLMSAVTRYYFEYDDKKKQDSALFTGYFLSLFTTIISIGTLFLLNHFFTAILFNNFEYPKYIDIYLIISFFININKIPLAQFRILEKSTLYAIINILQVSIQTILSLILIIQYDFKILGILIPLLTSQVLVALITHYHFFVLIKTRKIILKLIKPYLKYGIPLSLLLVSNWVIDFSDRFILEKFIDLDAVGIYNIGYSFALGITVISGAFTTAWPVISLSLMKHENVKYVYTKFITYYLFAIAIPCLLISFLVKDFFTLLHPSFIEGARVTPVIVFAYGIRGIYLILLSGTIFTKKTKYQLLIEIPPMVINVLLMLWWIPKYGFMGAAWSTLIAFALMPIITYLVNLKIYHISLELIRLIKIIIVIFILLAINNYLPVEFSVLNIFNKILIILLGFPFLLYLLHFYKDEEKEFIIKFFKKCK